MVSKNPTTPAVAILTGMTGSGKTAMAIDFARQRGRLEIINADSILIYRGMNIGSAKPSDQEMEEIPHHLVNIREPHQPYNVGEFRQDCLRILSDIHARNHRALIVGGTGFYLKSLLYGSWGELPASQSFRQSLAERSNMQLFEELSQKDLPWALKVTAGDRYRLIRALEVIHLSGQTPSELEAQLPKSPQSGFHLLVIDRNPDELLSRIRQRTLAMLQAGWIEETQNLMKHSPESRALLSVGYRQIVDFLHGKKPAGRKVSVGTEGLTEEILLATRQLVKRQRTWFKSQKFAEFFMLPLQEIELTARLAEIYQEPKA